MNRFKCRIGNSARYLILAPVLGLIVSSCADLRHFTYPRDFVYLDQAGISSLMHSLANSMQVLDDLAEKDTGPEKTAAFLAELEKIEKEAVQFSAAPDDDEPGSVRQMRTNHLLLDEHIDEFLAEVAAAKLQVQAVPPNYYVIGQLTGGCNSCHRRR